MFKEICRSCIAHFGGTITIKKLPVEFALLLLFFIQNETVTRKLYFYAKIMNRYPIFLNPVIMKVAFQKSMTKSRLLCN